MNRKFLFNSYNFEITTDWIVYACDFAQNTPDSYRVALGSFNEDELNHLVVAKADNCKGVFECEAFASLKYPASKVKFIYSDGNEFLITSGDRLRIWRHDYNHKLIVNEKDLLPQSDLAGPVISFDINKQNLLAGAQIDRTCTIWDLNHWDCPIHQFFAHSEEVIDVKFTKDDNVFLTIGAEGTCRQHDLRQKEKMHLIYDNKSRLLKLACSDTGLVALVSDLKYSILLVDLKKPGQLVVDLKEHRECVNQILWTNQQKLLSVSDDGFCLIWDIASNNKYTTQQAIAMTEEITNLCIQPVTNIVGCSYRNNFKIYDFN